MLKFIIPVIKHLGELEWYFRVALTREGVKNFWKLSFTNDGVLNFANCLITENDMCFVDAKLKRKEEDLNCTILITLFYLKLLLLDMERLRNT